MELYVCAVLEFFLVVSALFVRLSGGLPTMKVLQEEAVAAVAAEPAQPFEKPSVTEELVGIPKNQLLPKGTSHQPIPSYLGQILHGEGVKANTRPFIPEGDYNLLRSYYSLAANSGHIGCSIFMFDLRSLQHSEHLVRADLILYAKLRLAHATGLSPTVTVRAQMLEEKGRKRLLTEKRLVFRRSLNKTRPSQWARFNILEAVKAWSNGAPNMGIQIDVVRNGRVVPCGQRPVHFVRGTARKRMPVLLVYSQDEEGQRAHASSASLSRSLPSRQKRSLPDPPPPPAVHSCRRRKLEVDLRGLTEIGDLIAPKSLDIGYCEGLCEAPLSALMNHTNHARIQALLYKKNKHKIPQPCCVPYEFEPVRFLYYDLHGTFVMKFRYDVRVTGCACR